MVNFTVNAITPDAPCAGPYVQPAENGHFVVLDVTIETLPELADPNGGYSTFDMNASMFKFIGASGTTFNGNLGTASSFSCLPDEQLIPSGGVGPAEKVAGKVVLDVPETTGVLLFKSHLSSGGGWEYSF